MKNIVKRHGHQETYDEKKIYGSVYAAALNCHYSELRSENIAQKIMGSTTQWFKNNSKKNSISSDSIRNFIIIELEKIDSDVALMYKHHLDLS